MTKRTAAQTHAAIAAGALARCISEWINERFVPQAQRLPDLGGCAGPEEAAEIIRSEWTLGPGPISNTLDLLEAHGVQVYSLPQGCREIDAFSAWYDSVPFVFLAQDKSAERSRMDACHELAHLLLHRNRAPGREAEREADHFASALLMPRADIRRRLGRGMGLAGIVRAKSRWGVSAVALAYRAHRLGLLGDWQYRQVCIEASTRGYRTTEPEPMDRERSQVLSKVLAQLRSERVTASDIAEELAIPEAELAELMFGLPLVALPGGGRRRGPGTAPGLRLV